MFPTPRGTRSPESQGPSRHRGPATTARVLFSFSAGSTPQKFGRYTKGTKALPQISQRCASPEDKRTLCRQGSCPQGRRRSMTSWSPSLTPRAPGTSKPELACKTNTAGSSHQFLLHNRDRNIGYMKDNVDLSRIHKKEESVEPT